MGGGVRPVKKEEQGDWDSLEPPFKTVPAKQLSPMLFLFFPRWSPSGLVGRVGVEGGLDQALGLVDGRADGGHLRLHLGSVAFCDLQLYDYAAMCLCIVCVYMLLLLARRSFAAIFVLTAQDSRVSTARRNSSKSRRRPLGTTY